MFLKNTIVNFDEILATGSSEKRNNQILEPTRPPPKDLYSNLTQPPRAAIVLKMQLLRRLWYRIRRSSAPLAIYLGRSYGGLDSPN